MPLKKKYTKKSKKVKTRLVGGKRVKPNRRKLVRKSLKRKRVKGKKQRGGIAAITPNQFVRDNFKGSNTFNIGELKYGLLFNSLNIYGLKEYFQKIIYISDTKPSNISNILNIKERVLIHYISENNVTYLKPLINDLYIIYDVQESTVTNFFKHCINNNISTHGENTYCIKELVIHKDHKTEFETEFINYNKIVEIKLKVSVKEINRITDFFIIEFL